MRDHITITIRIFVSRPVTIRPCPKTARTTPTSVSLAGISQFHRIAITVHLNPSAGVVGRNRFSLLSRGQPIKYSSPRRFRTARGEGPFLSVELWSHTSGAAWRVRPSGPDSWAGSAVRRMLHSLGDGPRRHPAMQRRSKPIYSYFNYNTIYSILQQKYIQYLVFLKWASKYLNFCSFELLNVFCKHRPCVRHYSFCFLLGPFSS